MEGEQVGKSSQGSFKVVLEFICQMIEMFWIYRSNLLRLDTSWIFFDQGLMFIVYFPPIARLGSGQLTQGDAGRRQYL